MLELIQAVYDWFLANWSTIEGLARNLAADLATLWALGLALAQIIKKFMPQTGSAFQFKLLSILK